MPFWWYLNVSVCKKSDRKESVMSLISILLKGWSDNTVGPRAFALLA